MKASIFVLVALLSGCCWLSKRSCFPKCPPQLAAEVVKIEKPCELPRLKLPAFKETVEGCPEDRVCFDRANSGALYTRLARLKDFAKIARTRCAKPLPTSQPASKPATSQPTQ